MRLLLFLGFIWLLYYIFRRITSTYYPPSDRGHYGHYQSSNEPSKPPPVLDELVKDPVCGVYCPKKEAISIKINGKTYYFCSKDCRDKFLDQLNNSSNRN